MFRVVIDTDVIVSAFLSSAGASRQLLVDALDRKFALLLSTPLLVEYESVLLRPVHLERANATVSEVIEVLDGLADVCVPVAFDYTWRPTGAQADDELVMETAINGQAQAVATFSLKHFRTAGERFAIEVLHPGPLVKRLRQ